MFLRGGVVSVQLYRRPKSIHQYCAKGSPTNTLKPLWCICIFLLFPLKTRFLVYTKTCFFARWGTWVFRAENSFGVYFFPSDSIPGALVCNPFHGDVIPSGSSLCEEKAISLPTAGSSKSPGWGHSRPLLNSVTSQWLAALDERATSKPRPQLPSDLTGKYSENRSLTIFQG